MEVSLLRGKERGTSLLELTFAVAIIAVGMLVLLQQVTIGTRQAAQIDDQAFANRKAVAILAELQNGIDRGDILNADTLAAVAESGSPTPRLTTLTDPAGQPLAPDHSMSGNMERDGKWVWERLVEVEAPIDQPYLRYVKVSIFRRNHTGQLKNEAVLGAAMALTARPFRPIKEYDVYLLAMAEAPSLWLPMAQLRTMVETAAKDLQAMDQGVKLRLHWITKLGYGRDTLYSPYVNKLDLATTAAPWVYWYPGKLGNGEGNLYTAQMFSGIIRTEDGVLNGYHADDNPHPHAVADQFNHCLRTPQARDLFARRVAAGLETENEPPLQLLLADLDEDPDKFRNAIFVNLHGSGMAMPPLRNYSDAAKTPERKPGVRAVTHPTRLHTPRNELAVNQFDQLMTDLEAAALLHGGEIAIQLEDGRGDVQDAKLQLGEAPPDFAHALEDLDQAIVEMDDALADGMSETQVAALKTRLDALKAPLKEEILPDTGFVPAEFLVYAYKTDPDAGDVVLDEPITVQIMGVDLTARVNDGTEPTLELRRFVGGVDVGTGLVSGGDRDYSEFDESPAMPPRLDQKSASYEMCYEVGYVGGSEPYTWIRLHNTPLVAPVWEDEGLPASQRLYGMEYIPSPVDGGTFSVNLDSDGVKPKNTARWQIRIPRAALVASLGDADARVTVRTRIGTDVTTGRAWPTAHEPTNFSETYTWWAASADAVPITERYQILGDPRHNPYADLMVGGGELANGYNWHFDDLRGLLTKTEADALNLGTGSLIRLNTVDGGTTDVSLAPELDEDTGWATSGSTTTKAFQVDQTPAWPGLDRARLQDGFGNGVVADAPRLLQMLRQGLQSSGAIFVQAGGASGRTLLLGGEIARAPETLDAGPSGVTVHGSLMGTSGSVTVNSVSGHDMSVAYAGQHVVSGVGFWSKAWLGELFPDEYYKYYIYYGNLPTGEFHREVRGQRTLSGLPPGTDFHIAAGGMMGTSGSVALFDSGTMGRTFQHQRVDALNAQKTTAVDEIAGALKKIVPETMPALLPFGLERPMSVELPYFGFTDSYPKSTATLLETYYTSPSGLQAAGLIGLQAPTGPKTGFFCVLGMTPVTAQDHEDLAMTALMCGLRSFHRAGSAELGAPIVQQARVEVRSPASGALLKNPSSALLSWDTDFVRFDEGLFLSEEQDAKLPKPEESLVYSILYSCDDGETWHYGLNGEPAVPGEYPSDPDLLIPDSGTGAESFMLQTPSGQIGDGECLFRIECYSENRRTHMTHHQVRTMVRR